jgi:hypothetical protein
MLFTYSELSHCLRPEVDPMELTCLTLHAHWAAAIFELGKDVENRIWSTKHRGPLAIHAGKGFDPKICVELGLDPNKVRRGFILGTVELVDVVRNSPSRWADAGSYHWILATPKPLARPVMHQGKLGLHRVVL